MTARTVERMFLALAIAATLAAACLLLRSPSPLALGDYAEWTFHGVLFRDVLQGHPSAFYQLKHYPVPNSLTTVGLGLLMLVFSWKTAAAIWLVLQSALGLVSAYLLARASGKLQGWQLVVIASAVLFGGAFWYGFMNFLWGVFFAMLLCALLLRGCRRLWLLALILTLAFFSHMVPFAFALLALICCALQERDKRLLLPAIPGVLLSLAYFTGRFTHGNADSHAGMASSVPYLTPTFVAFKLNTFLKCFGFVNPSFNPIDSVLLLKTGPAIFLLLFALDIGLAAAALFLFFREGRLAFRLKSPARFLWLACTVFFVVALVMPDAAAGISDPGGRMMEVAVWSALLLVATRTPRASAALGLSSAVLLAADLFLLATVASAGPVFGSQTSPFPWRIREFGHIAYVAHWQDYRNIEQHKMDVVIYPTAMFLDTRPHPATPNSTP